MVAWKKRTGSGKYELHKLIFLPTQNPVCSMSQPIVCSSRKKFLVVTLNLKGPLGLKIENYLFSGCGCSRNPEWL